MNVISCTYIQTSKHFTITNPPVCRKWEEIREPNTNMYVPTHTRLPSLALFTLLTDSMFLLVRWGKMRAWFCNWEHIFVIETGNQIAQYFPARVAHRRYCRYCKARIRMSQWNFTVDTLHDRTYWIASLGMLFSVSISQSGLLALSLSFCPSQLFKRHTAFNGQFHLFPSFSFIRDGWKDGEAMLSFLLTTPDCPLCCQVSLIGP